MQKIPIRSSFCYTFCPDGIREHIRDMNEFETARNRYVDELKKCGRTNDPGKMEGIESKGIKVTSPVLTGDPADEILNVARNEMVHAIIMGSSGSLKRQHERKGIGSISRWISFVP